MSGDDRSADGWAALPLARIAEVEGFLDLITRWARDRDDIVGLLLVGSYARDAARPDSDVDVVLLTTDESRYLDNPVWARELGLGDLLRAQAWGPITERRHVTDSGLEVEIGIGSPAWATTEPVDAGTHRVVTDGARLLYDPTGLLAGLLTACQTPQ
ncbi:nucleotidyltransferase domain-containing protein [Kitasatospora sp. NPDC052896]|uniref:nucleotidyltransferase domain-containing protein n=1 Tax=Kitasatospora sp. NPDC052896 TaxID=3364061 RepID=UPI0037C77F93